VCGGGGGWGVIALVMPPCVAKQAASEDMSEDMSYSERATENKRLAVTSRKSHQNEPLAMAGRLTSYSANQMAPQTPHQNIATVGSHHTP
jgi:hypothetical protein